MAAHNHAVADGVVRSVSASQANTYVLCPRKWWLEKVAHIPRPQHPKAAIGESLHKQMEDYYNHGKEPSNGSALLLTRDPKVPRRDPALLIEEPRDFNLGITAAGIPVKGRIDLVDPSNTKHIRVFDWKFIGNLNYRERGDDLSRNIQGITYAYWAFHRYPAAELVTFFHGNGQNADGSAAVVEQSDAMDREHVEATYASRFVSVIEAIQQAASVTDPAAVECDESACYKFGRRNPCSYLGICKAIKAGEPVDLALEVAKAKFTFTAAPTPGEETMATRATGINPPDAARPTNVTAPPADGATTSTAPAGYRVTRIVIAKGETKNLGNYSSKRAEVTMEATVDEGTNVEEARGALSKDVTDALTKELNG